MSMDMSIDMKKRKDQRTESQTEGKIQYLTLTSISSLEHPQH